jgi:hypothetical protein
MLRTSWLIFGKLARLALMLPAQGARRIEHSQAFDAFVSKTIEHSQIDVVVKLR